MGRDALYTAEELELLQSEPELIELQDQIREARLVAEEEEVREMERQRQLDDAMEAPLLALRQKGRLWAEWSVQWWNYTAYDRALQQSIEALAQALLWVEDEELSQREAHEQTWLAAWEGIQNAERRRYRLITEWLVVWEEGRDAQWAEERQSHQRSVDGMLWYMSHGAAADEAEIARWEAEEQSLYQRLAEKAAASTANTMRKGGEKESFQPEATVE